MKRWPAVCALAVAGLVVGTAGSAAAQYPGANGYRATQHLGPSDVPTGDWGPDFPCMNGERYLADLGGSAYSPDGRKLAAISQDGGGGTPLNTTAVGDGVPLRVVSASATCSPVYLADVDVWTTLSFSPTGAQLAVTRNDDVVVLDATTGKDVRNLTPNLASTSESDPTWDPRNTGIAYTASDGLRVRPPTGGASRLLVKGVARHPDWSPDGTKIAYLDATGHISYLTLATHVVTRTPIVADTFVWSPNGAYFFFGVDSSTCATATTTGRIVSRQVVGGCEVLAWQPKR